MTDTNIQPKPCCLRVMMLLEYGREGAGMAHDDDDGRSDDATMSTSGSQTGQRVAASVVVARDGRGWWVVGWDPYECEYAYSLLVAIEASRLTGQVGRRSYYCIGNNNGGSSVVPRLVSRNRCAHQPVLRMHSVGATARTTAGRESVWQSAT